MYSLGLYLCHSSLFLEILASICYNSYILNSRLATFPTRKLSLLRELDFKHMKLRWLREMMAAATGASSYVRSSRPRPFDVPHQFYITITMAAPQSWHSNLIWQTQYSVLFSNWHYLFNRFCVRRYHVCADVGWTYSSSDNTLLCDIAKSSVTETP